MFIATFISVLKKSHRNVGIKKMPRPIGKLDCTHNTTQAVNEQNRAKTNNYINEDLP